MAIAIAYIQIKINMQNMRTSYSETHSPPNEYSWHTAHCNYLMRQLIKTSSACVFDYATYTKHVLYAFGGSLWVAQPFYISPVNISEMDWQGDFRKVNMDELNFEWKKHLIRAWCHGYHASHQPKTIGIFGEKRWNSETGETYLFCRFVCACGSHHAWIYGVQIKSNTPMCWN